MEYCLETQALCKTYGRFRAVDNLSMHVPRGAIYGFVGKNGAGKTTLLRLICGLQRPTAGGYCLYGVPHTDKALCTVRRRMGAVVETPSIYMDLPAQENLKQQYRVLGLPSFSGIPALLELVGLQDTGRKTAGSRSACASGSASRWRSQATPTSSCSTSRRTASTRRASSRCAS